MVGSKVEHAGIIRHGAKMLHVMSRATVPKITVVVRKAYGAGYYVMCGRAYEPDLIVAWPTGEISVMGAEGMVGIAARKKLRGGATPRGQAGRAIEKIQKNIDIYIAAGARRRRDRSARHARAICRGLEMAAGQEGRAPLEETRSRTCMRGALE